MEGRENPVTFFLKQGHQNEVSVFEQLMTQETAILFVSRDTGFSHDGSLHTDLVADLTTRGLNIERVRIEPDFDSAASFLDDLYQARMKFLEEESATVSKEELAGLVPVQDLLDGERDYILELLDDDLPTRFSELLLEEIVDRSTVEFEAEWLRRRRPCIQSW